MIPICLSPNPYTSLKQRLFADVLTFSLGCNPAWTGDLTSGVSYWEVCHTQWFCSLALSQTHTQCMHTNMPANAYKYLPRCEFLLREGLLCAAISISSQNTLIILPGSLILPLTFSFCDLSFTHTYTQWLHTIQSVYCTFSQFDLNIAQFHYDIQFCISHIIGSC